MEEDVVEIVVEELADFSPVTNILVHGPAGGGKTTLTSSVPNSTYLSTEIEGAVSAKIAGSKGKLIRAQKWEHCVAGVKWAEEKLGPEDWLVVDSGTKMQELYLRWILDTIHKANPHRDLDIPAVADHQKYQNGFKRWYDRIIDMPCNTIFVTQSMVTEDAEGETRVIPLILGKRGEISEYVSAQAGVILYYGVSRESRENPGDPITRRALAQPYPPWLAKDRYTALGKFIDVKENDFGAMRRMIAAIEKAKGNGQAPVAAYRGTARRPRRAVR
jgi:AAA domain